MRLACVPMNAWEVAFHIVPYMISSLHAVHPDALCERATSRAKGVLIVNSYLTESKHTFCSLLHLSWVRFRISVTNESQCHLGKLIIASQQRLRRHDESAGLLGK